MWGLPHCECDMPRPLVNNLIEIYIYIYIGSREERASEACGTRNKATRICPFAFSTISTIRLRPETLPLGDGASR